MPSKKSARSLEELCIANFRNNINILHHTAKYLPIPLINHLYDKCVRKDKNYSSPTLYADLFLHEHTEKVNRLEAFDRPVNEIVEKMSSLCKNLQRLYLRHEEVEYVYILTINNPHIELIDLRDCMCTDQHLSIISKHCPQLRHLTLYSCTFITDEGINFLPDKLESLLIWPCQITLQGSLNALERLPHLKHIQTGFLWEEAINQLAESFTNRGGNRTYQIEKIFISHQRTSYDIPHSIGALFPKLRAITFTDSCMLGSDVAVYLKAINYNLLTYLLVHVSAEFVKIAAHLCPMLEDLRLIIVTDEGNQPIDDQYLMTPKNTPFKYLRKLDLRIENAELSTNDFKLLLTNCQQLERLLIDRYDQLTDQLIYDILAANPMKYLNFLKFSECLSFSIDSLWVLMKSLDSLANVYIYFCTQLSLEDKIATEKLISDMNWNLELGWDFENLIQLVIL